MCSTQGIVPWPEEKADVPSLCTAALQSTNDASSTASTLSQVLIGGREAGTNREESNHQSSTSNQVDANAGPISAPSAGLPDEATLGSGPFNAGLGAGVEGDLALSQPLQEAPETGAEAQHVDTLADVEASAAPDVVLPVTGEPALQVPLPGPSEQEQDSTAGLGCENVAEATVLNQGFIDALESPDHPLDGSSTDHPASPDPAISTPDSDLPQLPQDATTAKVPPAAGTPEELVPAQATPPETKDSDAESPPGVSDMETNSSHQEVSRSETDPEGAASPQLPTLAPAPEQVPSESLSSAGVQLPSGFLREPQVADPESPGEVDGTVVEASRQLPAGDELVEALNKARASERESRKGLRFVRQLLKNNAGLGVREMRLALDYPEATYRALCATLLAVGVSEDDLIPWGRCRCAGFWLGVRLQTALL